MKKTTEVNKKEVEQADIEVTQKRVSGDTNEGIIMRIHMIEPKVFVDCFKSINEFINEGKIKVDKDKMTITGMDAANVCMVDFEFLSANCSEWDVKKELEIPLNMSNLKITDKMLIAHNPKHPLFKKKDTLL